LMIIFKLYKLLKGVGGRGKKPLLYDRIFISKFLFYFYFLNLS
jgi:hypothetical protein